MSRVAEPRVEEALPGLWSLPVTVPIPSLAYVLVYALEVPGGIVLVDAGWSNSDSLASLEAGLAALGAALEDVRGVVFTHSHGDHYGLAGPVRERSDAWLALHAADAAVVRRQLERGGIAALLDDWLAEAGIEAGDERPSVPAGFGWEFPLVAPDRELVDGQRLDLPGRELKVLHTPGHSPGHVCLVDAAAGFVLTGDHVLARTTPNVSALPGSPPDPLDDYLRSLELVAALGDLRGLPGHEEPMPSVAARAREIVEHHDEQFASVRETVAEGPVTVRDVAARMPWSRPWSGLRGFDRILALGEAKAHLLALERRGEIVRLAGDRPLRFRVA